MIGQLFETNQNVFKLVSYRIRWLVFGYCSKWRDALLTDALWSSKMFSSHVANSIDCILRMCHHQFGSAPFTEKPSGKPQQSNPEYAQQHPRRCYYIPPTRKLNLPSIEALCRCTAAGKSCTWLSNRFIAKDEITSHGPGIWKMHPPLCARWTQIGTGPNRAITRSSSSNQHTYMLLPSGLLLVPASHCIHYSKSNHPDRTQSQTRPMSVRQATTTTRTLTTMNYWYVSGVVRYTSVHWEVFWATIKFRDMRMVENRSKPQIFFTKLIN